MYEQEIRPLPGSVRIAETIERREFLRRVSTTLFMGFAAASAGTAGVLGFLADPAKAAGACCPSCCGPSPCCNTSCCNKTCCPDGGSYICGTSDGCEGRDTRYYGGAGCWSCHGGCGSCSTTICCDCKTNNTTGCPNFTNRCICHQCLPECGPQGAQTVFAITGGRQRGERW